jgi:hypothetical protein
MHSSLPLPQSLARLFGIIAAFERARAAQNPLAAPRPRVLERLTDSRDQAPAEYRSDLDVFSLSTCEPPASRRSDDLGFRSLSVVAGTGLDGRDSLGDLSLERSFPPAPQAPISSTDAKRARPTRTRSAGRRCD